VDGTATAPGDSQLELTGHVLGPVELRCSGTAVRPRGLRQRAIVAALTLAAGEPVPAEGLADAVWGPALPATALVQVQSCVAALRRSLAAVSGVDGKTLLVTEAAGYRLALDAAGTDLGAFRVGVDLGRELVRSGRRREAVAALRDALAIWRGPALADVPSVPLRARAERLDEERVAAQELRIEAELAELGELPEGAGGALVSELTDLVERHPLRERPRILLMSALWRGGRPADALAQFQDYRARLVEELGLEPGGAARELERRILVGSPTPTPTPTPTPERAATPDRGPVPRQLPTDVPLLVGRDELLDELEAWIRSGPRGSRCPALVCLHGAAGVGKSATATRLAHRVRDAFPDGQLFVRLPESSGTAAVVGGLLRATGTPPAAVPDDPAERVALWRTTSAEARLLLLLEDATTEAEVRPLLPANPHAAVVVTSRRPLAVLEAARHAAVTGLDQAAAVALLAAIAPGPVVRQPEQAALVVRQCEGLPLALRIVAARLAASPALDLAAVADSLADQTRRLSWLVAGDLAMRASLALSVRALDPLARSVLRRLSLVGTDFSPWAAAALAGCPEERAAGVLDELTALSLLQPSPTGGPGRFRQHDLVRSLATELAAAEEPPEELAEAGRRHLRTLLHLAAHADGALGHGMRVAEGVWAEPAVAVPAGLAGALADPGGWLDRELPALVAGVDAATRAGCPNLAAGLAVRANGILAVRDRREERIALLETAQRAVGEAGPAGHRARLAHCLFGAYAQAGLPVGDLLAAAERSLATAEDSGDRTLRLGALVQVGYAAKAAGRLDRARAAYESALALLGPGPEEHGLRAKYLCGLGDVLREQGDAEAATGPLREALGLEPAGSRIRAMILVDLANALVDLGGAGEAGGHLAEAERIVAGLGDELGLAHVRCAQARVAALGGDWPGSRRATDEAGRIFAEHADRLGAALVGTVAAEAAARRGDGGGAVRLLEHVLAEIDPRVDPLGTRRAAALLATVRHATQAPAAGR
jgi:DNA-binding SARP family transcriptional activator/tetratricopeptide (TPR) repeat protein